MFTPDSELSSSPTDAATAKRELNKLQKRLRRNVGTAITDYGMIRDGDKVMVCLSGGKDSYTMLDILMNLQRNAPVQFTLVAVNLDQKQPGFPEHVLPAWLESVGVEYHILERDTYSIVKEKVPEGKTTCGLCSRLRRGSLYGFATEIGATKIALGHHRDDILETLFLNMFFGGKLKTMPPKLLSDDQRHIVIRPLAYCRESDIEAYSNAREFPIIPCNLCGSQENLQRQVVKEMLQDWEKKHPGRLETMFHAVTSVAPSHLADRDLFDFAGLDEHRDRFQASRIDALDMSSEQAGMADDLFEAERRVKPLADSAASLGHEL
ncbi:MULTISPECIES: tRNA 2-thiocytidine(32) synthetase TtcA [unclassified Cobetia]|uniref:tRNA 2-thiocytidine(32) synthetase TtcA n=1 Tax=unclassified Cobetia TaxID=2609414 RepID=UPI002096F8D3|nr:MULTISPECIES: tRNA 2-thiocytidine(32) synthetase TtcA [unclassified Cobetia]MCO7233624.1 tRNA 2-thiocytidine(32) synthetase TtcA [Cobetia sp. Dlab-2-AX]MCO7236904.1 tRNA 2-thiocytidine(32) synthetase TtcA [Cobetia sp. Dlab-2-U]